MRVELYSITRGRCSTVVTHQRTLLRSHTHSGVKCRRRLPRDCDTDVESFMRHILLLRHHMQRQTTKHKSVTKHSNVIVFQHTLNRTYFVKCPQKDYIAGSNIVFIFYLYLYFYPSHTDRCYIITLNISNTQEEMLHRCHTYFYSRLSFYTLSSHSW